MLDLAELHPSLSRPVLDAVTFLNEVRSRYPQAISFAPGAPHPETLARLDIERYVELHLGHVMQTHGLDHRSARLLLAEYGPSRGLINDLVAAALRREAGIDVTERAIVITAGAQEGLLLTLRALFAAKSDLLAVTSPCYVGVLGAAELLGLETVAISDSPTGPDLEMLEEAVRRARAAGARIRAFYVAPDFANPSGSSMDQEARHRLVDLARRADLFLLEDNPYGFTAEPGRAQAALKSLDPDGRVVLLGTFSKICLPGARVGYLVADRPVRRRSSPGRLLADEIAALKTMTTVNTSPLCQSLIGGMLLEADLSFERLWKEKRQLYRRNLETLLGALERRLGTTPAISWNRPGGGFFVRLRLPVKADAPLLERSASRFGVIWTPMSTFYLDRAGDREIRLSCSYLSEDEIVEGVDRLAAFCRSLSPDVDVHGGGEVRQTEEAARR